MLRAKHQFSEKNGVQQLVRSTVETEVLCEHMQIDPATAMRSRAINRVQRIVHMTAFWSVVHSKINPLASIAHEKFAEKERFLLGSS